MRLTLGRPPAPARHPEGVGMKLTLGRPPIPAGTGRESG